MAAKIATDAQAKAASAGDRLQVDFPDSKVGGLALRVTKAGKKTWTLRYRNADGLQRRLTIGQYPGVGLSDARQAGWDAIGASAKVGDPAKEKQARRSAARARKASTVSELIDRYFEDAAKGRHRPNGKPKRESTLDLEKYYNERFIKPRFGRLPIADLTRSDVQKFVNELADEAAANARHCRNVIRQAYNYAIRNELADKNPAQLVTLAALDSRDRVLSDKELKAIWTGADHPGRVSNSLTLSDGVGTAMMLAMVTLQRGGEVIGLHAREIDLDQKLWTIPATRTKNHQAHVVPLTEASIALLERAFGSSRHAEWKGFAFPSPRKKNRAITRRALSRATKRLTTALKIEDATPHDFRRTGSTNITGERIGIPHSSSLACSTSFPILVARRL